MYKNHYQQERWYCTVNSKVKEYVQKRKEELKAMMKGREVTLAVIQVGDNPASNSYIKGKKKDCEEVGIHLNHIRLDEDITMTSLLHNIDLLNLDPKCNGIIVQLPIPLHLDVKEVQERIDPKKDVDGFHPMSYFEPCTPSGVVNFLVDTGYHFSGSNALVIGRSDIVGKPLANMLTDLDCTVTLAHSKTYGIKLLMQRAHIVFTAIDKIEWYSSDYATHLKYADFVIDIGLGISDKDGKLHGNLSRSCVDILKSNDNTHVLSGVGGVGLLTRLQLVENTIMASIIQTKEK